MSTRNTLGVVALMLAPWAAAAQDHRVTYLEQEVRSLQRQVMALSRQVEQLSRPAPRPERPALSDAHPAGQSSEQASDRASTHRARVDRANAAWVNAGKWQRLRVGMGELEVIALLGPPTSMRQQDGARVLLYAMELGASGFLGGSVTFRDRAVSEIRKPELQ
jgi:hypothetical protein